MKRLLLILIVFIGAALRFTNLNWDAFQAFHPDERNIAWTVTRIDWTSNMNPKFFAYGGLPIYLYKLLSDGVAISSGDPTWTTEWGKIAVVGRYLSATLSSVSILLIFLVGRRFFSPTVGILAAFFLAFSPWAIREAHFATTESMLVFFLLSLLMVSHQWLKHHKKRTLISLGIIWGLSVGTKTTSLLFAVIALLALGKTKYLIGFILIAASVFLLVSPYTVLDFQHFRESMDYETGVALGRFSVPYTLQFKGTTPYVYQIKTMLWQSGPTVILGVAGIVFLAVFSLRKYFLFLVFPLLYFLWSGSWYAKFARYTVPFLPFATLAASWLMVSLLQKISKKSFYWIICLFVYLFIGLLHSLWGVANWTVYLRPQTRIAASEWISGRVPAGTTLLTEHWNDGLSVASYPRELINVYDDDTEIKINTLADQLERADYLILTTRRIWGVMPRLTARYPKTSAFYTLLLAGKLGYTEKATFTSYPSLFGVVINDDLAEESIQVFDHPTVRIFKKNAGFTKKRIIDLSMGS